MKLLALLAVGTLWCSAAVATPPSQNAAELATREGRWSDALTLWQALSDAKPSDAGVTAEVGFAELNTGSVQDAKRTFNRAARLDPANLRAQVGLVELAITEHRFDDAVTIATKAAKTHPDSADAYRCLGDAQKASSRRADAEEAYRRAVALSPEDWRNHARLADAVLIRNKADEAVKEYRVAARLHPGDTALRESLGKAAMAGARYGEAARCYIDAMDLARTQSPDWDRLDRLALAAIDALSRAAAALRDGNEARQDVFEANTHTVTLTDALLDLPAVGQADLHTSPAMAQRATAYTLMGQAAAADLAALRKTSGSDAADAAVFREQARRAIVAAKAASARTPSE